MIPDNTFDVIRGFKVNDILVHSGGAYVCIDNTPSRAVWKYRSKSIKEDYGSLNVITQSDWNQTNNTQADYIKNKPTEFPPSAHEHIDSEVELTETYTGNLAGAITQKDANDILDSLAGGGETEKRFDFISNLLYYKGTAPTGSSEDSAVWKIDKIECLANGSIDNITTVLNHKWTERNLI